MSDPLKPDERDLSASMHDFEAAVSAKRFDLKLPRLDRILVAVDGSNQSPFAVAMAAELAGRSSATLHVLYAYPGARDAGRDREVDEQVARLAQRGLAASAVPRAAAVARPYEEILARADALQVDLIVLPAPYLEDFDELGSDSVGLTLDKLMTNARPLLVVREPRDDPRASLRPVLLPLTVHLEENPLAAGWALKILGDGGTLRVVAVVEDGVMDMAADLIGDHAAADLDLDRLAGLDRPETAGLIAELHRETRERSLGCHVSVRRGDLVGRVIEVAEEAKMLIVTGADTDPASRSYRDVQALIRASRDPVLVV